jgi:AcrR family transcriptional regulator
MVGCGLDIVKLLSKPVFPRMTSRLSPESPADGGGLRERILLAAEQLLDGAGPGGLSMREVARRVGVTHQAPYHHFGDRETILAELVTRGLQELASRLAMANEGLADGKPLEAAIASGEAYVGYALDHPGLFRVMFRPDLCDASRFVKVEQAGEQAYRQLAHMVATLYATSETDTLAQVYWAQVHGLAVLLLDGPLGAMTPDTGQRRGLARQALTVFARQMLARPLGD